MKVGVAFLLGSLVVNLAAFAVLVLHPASARPAMRRLLPFGGKPTAAAVNMTAHASTNDEPARPTPAGAWQAVDSEDPRTLVMRLRSAGFPPAMVRAIVTAVIDERHAARWKQLFPAHALTPYWRAAPRESAPQWAAWGAALRERSQALRDAFSGEPDSLEEGLSDEQRWRFGHLSKAKIELIERINSDYDDLTAQVRTVMADIPLPADRDKSALLERERRADLAAVLSPEERADYELRTSPVTRQLRAALTLMDATEAEFRAIFPLQEQLMNRPRTGDPDEFAQQRAAQLQFGKGLEGVIGEARAAAFMRAQDFGFRELATIAQRESLPREAAVRAYEVRNTAAAESMRLSKDRSLAEGQYLTAMQNLAQATKGSLADVIGPDAAEAYAGSSDWLRAIANGSAVAFDGGMTSISSRDGSMSISSYVVEEEGPPVLVPPGGAPP